ncbi:MAG: TolB protein [Nocardioidaceae bacterium]|jgi:Tol biopolymer transport system component|nr:TolB protein [Nocardioidaceae bacterium]
MMSKRGGFAFIAGSVLALALASPAAAMAGAAHQTTGAGTPAVRDGRIAFASCAATCQILTVNPDGSALQQLTHFRAAFADNPTWSPDGSKITFNLFRFHAGRGPRLYTMNADGTGLHLAAPEKAGYFDGFPDYTPDGKRIVFTRFRPDPPGGAAIYSVRSDGTDRQAITHYRHGIRAGADRDPQVSPDGRWVLFDRRGWKGIRSQVWVARIDGTDAHPITPARLGAWYGRWSPNGKAVYFHAGPPGPYGYAIYRTPVTGSHVTQLTFSPYPTGAFFPAPSPSGDHVAFSSTRNFPDACCAQLFVMNSDGSHQHLVDTGGDAEDADWGTAPLQTGPSVHLPPASRAEIRATRKRMLRAEPWAASR